MFERADVLHIVQHVFRQNHFAEVKANQGSFVGCEIGNVALWLAYLPGLGSEPYAVGIWNTGPIYENVPAENFFFSYEEVFRSPPCHH